MLVITTKVSTYDIINKFIKLYKVVHPEKMCFTPTRIDRIKGCSPPLRRMYCAGQIERHKACVEQVRKTSIDLETPWKLHRERRFGARKLEQATPQSAITEPETSTRGRAHDELLRSDINNLVVIYNKLSV